MSKFRKTCFRNIEEIEMGSFKEKIHGICNGSELLENSLEFFGNSIFNDIIDEQECEIFDYKKDIPRNFSDEYGFGIIKLIISFYNSYGGIIFFGVDDNKKILGVIEDIDIENINHFINAITSQRISCRSKRIYIDNNDKFINAIIVGKRGCSKPLSLNKKILRYKEGSIFIRKDHEVCIADSRDLSFLYSQRQFAINDRYPVHKALPPSPATIKDFVGRYQLEIKLWNWLLHEDQPRFYLFGDGGAGKSTLAYEFSKIVSECGGDLSYSNGSPLDYVVYLSAKETELNSSTGKIIAFTARDFSNTLSQFKKILLLAGVEDDTSVVNIEYDEALLRLKNLFNEYAGLIIIDDIDALTRNSLDSGEEILLLTAMRSSKTTKILYTLRFEPQYAKTSSEKISGLSWEEYNIFIESCCKQFNIKPPKNEEKSKIYDEANHLPLLIETICGLRRDCSDYLTAISMFKEKGGDEARNYLYQREFYKIQRKGITKYILICLSYLDLPVSFSEICVILPYSEQDIRDSITELSSIFLAMSVGENGETLYSATKSSIPFLEKIHSSENVYESTKRCVDNYKKIPSSLSREENRILMLMEKCVRQKQYSLLISEVNSSVPVGSPLRAEPRFFSLLGQAHALISPPNYQEAAVCFKEARKRKYSDIYMLRQWYYVCTKSDIERKNTEDVCKIVINDPDISPRYASEFYCKLGDYFYNISYRDRLSNSDRAQKNCLKSAEAYLDAIAIGQNISEIDTILQISWLKKVIVFLMSYNQNNVENVCDVISKECSKPRDLNIDVANFLSDCIDLFKTNKKIDLKISLRIMSRHLEKIKKANKYRDNYYGIDFIVKSMERLIGELHNYVSKND